MTSNLSQFHFLASTVPNKFDFEAEEFDVGNIYQFYSLKVSLALSPTLSFDFDLYRYIAPTHASVSLP